MYLNSDLPFYPLVAVDARVKMVAAAALLIMVLTYQMFMFPMMVIMLFAGSCFVFGVPLRMILIRFAEPLFLVTMIIVIKFLCTGDHQLFEVKLAGVTFAGHLDGLQEGFRIGIRVLAAVSIVAAFGFATPFSDILAASAWFRVPREFIEILMLAYRYLFVILEEAFVIYYAQKNRLGYTTVTRGLVSFGVLSGTLVLKAFDRSQITTAAMIRRGYDGTFPLQQFRALKPVEVTVTCLLLIVFGVLWKL